MISVANVNAAQAASYYAADDYYTADDPPSAWFGKGCEALGLSGEVGKADLHELLNGRLPNGQVIKKGGSGKRAGTDFTISAPKSISIAALVHGDQAILNAHNEAVKKTLVEIEKRIQTRVQIDKQQTIETTGKAIIASVLHDTSRAGDPALHTHSVVLNVTQRADGKWVSIENNQLFVDRAELDLVYKSELAKSLKALGHELRPTKNSFELAQIDQKTIDHFSQRKESIDAQLKEMGMSRETASATAKQAATLNTRNKKEKYNRDELVQDWQERYRSINPEKLREYGNAVKRISSKTPETPHSALVYAIEHLSEREQAFSKKDLLKVAQAHVWGDVTHSQLVSELAAFKEKGLLIEKGDKRLTTPQAVALESRILSAELAGRASLAPALPLQEANDFLKTTTLNEGQRQAASLIASTENRISGIQGYAGTGKTFTLDVARQAVEKSGFKLVGLAPTKGAVEALGEAKIEGSTVARFLTDTDAQAQLNSKSIVVLDESSLVSAKDLEKVISIVESRDARLVLVGDTKQYQSVAAGAIFEQLQQAGMQTAQVTEMKRQKTETLKQAAALSVQGKNAQALAHLDVREISESSERHQAIAKAYSKIDDHKDSLILTGTNVNRIALNHAVRQEIGLAGSGRDVQVFEKADLTTAQKKFAASFVPGQSLKFNRDLKSLGIARGQTMKIQQIEGETLVLEGKAGKTIDFQPFRFAGSAFDAGEVKFLEVAKGERIRFDANSKELGVTNGQRATVLEVSEKNIKVQLDSGKKLTLPISDPLPLRHGYAQTGHSAQGLGVKTVLMDRASHDPTTSQRQFMTDLTRAKEELIVFTDDREKLAESVDRQVSKSTALDEELAKTNVLDTQFQSPPNLENEVALELWE